MPGTASVMFSAEGAKSRVRKYGKPDAKLIFSNGAEGTQIINQP